MANVITQFVLVNAVEDTSVAAITTSSVSITADTAAVAAIGSGSNFTANLIVFKGADYCGYFKQFRNRGETWSGRFNLVKVDGEQGFFLPTIVANYAF